MFEIFRTHQVPEQLDLFGIALNRSGQDYLFQPVLPSDSMKKYHHCRLLVACLPYPGKKAQERVRV